jgi:ATP-binding protein involved in chromosome partitioning
MKIALPVTENRLCTHFGHCEKFAVYDVSDEERAVTASVYLNAPPHQPGILPRWLADKGVKCVIAGGMGSHALNIFRECGITAVAGAPPGDPTKIVQDYLAGNLAAGDNVCDH